MVAFDIMMAALRFKERINASDLESLSSMMTPDNTFIDKEGGSIRREGDDDIGLETILRALPRLPERLQRGSNPW